MKKALQIVLGSFLLFSVSYGQLVFEENFGYAAGSLLNANGYKVSSGTTNLLTVTATNLTYPSYPSVTGNALTLAATGEDVYKSFDPVSSGSVYLSFLLNVQSAQTGDYFIALSPTANQTFYTGRTFIKSNGTGYSMGITKSSEISTANYGTSILNFGTTYMVVVKYTFNSGSDVDDALTLYVLKGGAMLSTEPTPEFGPYVCADVAKKDQLDLTTVTFRQGGSSSGPALILDGVRVTKSWLSVTDVRDESAAIPTKYSLNQNYPNPFNPSTVINYQLPEAGNVALKVYDVLGNEVATLVNEFKQAGVYNAKFANSNLSSGIYLYRLQAGSFVSVKRMILIK
ncbi:MAG: T9SS type A sorting domain-containing protein [Ignavibacteria bacterium]|nr:T9SS type A sorting domain-containing protein [Ignavibacteria bacterium]